MGSSGAPVVAGHIDSGKIYEAHTQIKAIVEQYKDTKATVALITQRVKDNWVGKGRNEFEFQYETLIRKIDDFGDTLYEIYEALVNSEKAYRDLDDELRQDYTMSMQE